MRQKNARGQERIITPAGYTKAGQPALRGANICDECHNFLGWWDAKDMPKDIRRQLQRELEANWFPHYNHPEDY